MEKSVKSQNYSQFGAGCVQSSHNSRKKCYKVVVLSCCVFCFVFFIAVQTVTKSMLEGSKGWATWPIWAVIKKYDLKLFSRSFCVVPFLKQIRLFLLQLEHLIFKLMTVTAEGTWISIHLDEASYTELNNLIRGVTTASSYIYYKACLLLVKKGSLTEYCSMDNRLTQVSTKY